MAITKVIFKNFTAFDEMEILPSDGINIFIGANGTGKTHIMKAIYASCDITKSKLNLADKLVRTFLPSNRALGRLSKRQKTSSKSSVEIFRNDLKLKISFSNHTTAVESARITGTKKWIEHPVDSVYIPVKEMLSNAPGFRSLYAQREIHFEEIYADIIDRAFRPMPRGTIDKKRKKLLLILQKMLDGKVTMKDEEFFLKNKQGNLEFTLLAEGMRKLGLLWLLIQNGTLLNGSVLFWDEPETNLNPKLFGPIIDILLELEKMGVQIFIATHDYVILKEFDLRASKESKIIYHSLYREDKGDSPKLIPVSNFSEVHPNAILDTFDDLYSREIKRSLSGSSV